MEASWVQSPQEIEEARQRGRAGLLHINRDRHSEGAEALVPEKWGVRHHPAVGRNGCLQGALMPWQEAVAAWC